MDVAATLVNGFDDCDKPGDYFLYKSSKSEEVFAGMVFCCPCGCGVVGAIPFDTEFNSDSGPKWKWNGSVQKPTLNPSIQKTSTCRWHGYLTDGVFKDV